MNFSTQIAKHFREVYFGGNWTASDMKTALTELTWQQATTKIHDFNSIATLIFHTNYYVKAVSKVLEGKPLDAKDELSFAHPAIQNQEDWEKFLQEVWEDAEKFASLIEQLPENQLFETFTDEKYGNYYRNLQGIIEHTHYHLGQIVLIKKLLSNMPPVYEIHI